MPALRPNRRPAARRAIRSSLLAARHAPRSGLTLIEMLMATAITLLMMAAIVNLFATMTASISNRRALIELNGQIRQVRQRLTLDLAGCTVPSGEGGIMPWRQRPGEAIGYLEIVEGGLNDGFPSLLIDGINTPTATPPNYEIDYATSIIPSSQGLDSETGLAADNRNVGVGAITDGRGLGDADDVLALTVRSLDEPFVANVPNAGRVESNLAEVIWWASENPADESQGEPGLRKIYRRVLIIAPWLGGISDDQAEFVSSHRDPVSGNRIANTLADLTRREFRWSHDYDRTNANNDAYRFPHVFQHPGASNSSFVVLSDALAFDVRVYDPGAPLLAYKGLVVEPGDPGWREVMSPPSPNPTIVGFGAYVDLGWDDNGGSGGGPNYIPSTVAPFPPAPMFQRARQVGWDPVRAASAPNFYRGDPCTYDTWTWHYENDGVDQPGVGGALDNFIDLARNGIDDDGFNGVDDVGERETSPPYPVPLRGVKVILRTYERDARQVREVSVTNSFVP